jgi:8-oxo-dGTP pyrophosphatase MutT (NUDIX family)
MIEPDIDECDSLSEEEIDNTKELTIQVSNKVFEGTDFDIIKKERLNSRLYKKYTKTIDSFGVITFYDSRKQDGNLYFLICQPRDNYGYVSLIRGLWSDDSQIIKHLLESNKEERERLMKYSIDELWKDLFVDHRTKICKEGYPRAKAKFSQLRERLISLLSSIDQRSDIGGPPWGFAKGKRNDHESKIQCALREFEEETRISKYYIKILDDFVPFREMRYGSNGTQYQAFYYVAESSCMYTPKKIATPQCLRSDTISDEIIDLKWVTIKEAATLLPSDRFNMIRKLYNILMSD